MHTKKSNKELTVEAVYDCRLVQSQPVHAESYFNTLSEAEWTELRKASSRARNTDASPALRCGDCREAVYARNSIKGRRHCRHFAGDHSHCLWSQAKAGDIRAIDVAKFQGQQEGWAHKQLSQYVKQVLNLDRVTAKAGVSFRRYTKSENGKYAYPDVYAAQWQGAPAVFEIQLSTTHSQVIQRREDFYRDAGIRLIWIVGRQSKNLNKQAFRDIYLDNGGQIFGIDHEVLAEAQKAKVTKFRLYRLLPGSPEKGFEPNWRDRIVTADEIDWGQPGDRPHSVNLSYDDYLNEIIEKNVPLRTLRLKFYEALKTDNKQAASEAWNAVVKITGGHQWESLPSSYDTMSALGVLVTLRTGVHSVQTSIDPENSKALVNSMLLEPLGRRCWTHAFELLCRAKGLEDLLNVNSIRAKCMRNKLEQQEIIPIDLVVGPVFNVFFPEGAFQRVIF